MKAFCSTFSLIASFLVATSASAGAIAEALAEAQAYLQTWEDRGREACEDNERGCAAAGHALDRAAAAYERAGRLDKAITIRKMILDPKWHLDYTDYGRVATYALARNYQSIAEYEESAQIAELAVRRFAKSEDAPGALVDAIVLRLAMKQFDKAVEDAQTFQKFYGTKRPDDVVKIVIAVGNGFWEDDRAKETIDWLTKAMSTVNRFGSIADRMSAHTLLGRAYAHEGVADKAAVEYDIVRTMWKEPDAARTFLESAVGSEEQKLRRLGRTLEAVGEARFFFAEQKRAQADSIHFPKVSGVKNEATLIKFVNAHVAEWLNNKRVAVEEAESAYRTIIEIQPAPPPKWVVASALRVGQLWDSFVNELRHAPMPEEWNFAAVPPGANMPGNELKVLFRSAVFPLIEQHRKQAKAAFELCLSYSVKFQYADEYSQSCFAWLSKNHPKTWPSVDEILPSPTKSAMPIIISPALLDMPSLTRQSALR